MSSSFGINSAINLWLHCIFQLLPSKPRESVQRSFLQDQIKLLTRYDVLNLTGMLTAFEIATSCLSLCDVSNNPLMMKSPLTDAG